MSDRTDDQAPQGFVPFTAPSPYVQQLGPMFCRTEPDGRFTLGLRLRDAHANLHGIAHGGMLATVVDNALGWNIASLGQPVVTVHLSIDFLQAARVGAWLEARIEYRRQGNRLTFADVLLYADAVCVVRATGILSALQKK
jgi:uncharacterized protein (TIGR00369 family)